MARTLKKKHGQKKDAQIGDVLEASRGNGGMVPSRFSTIFTRTCENPHERIPTSS